MSCYSLSCIYVVYHALSLCHRTWNGVQGFLQFVIQLVKIKIYLKVNQSKSYMYIKYKIKIILSESYRYVFGTNLIACGRYFQSLMLAQRTLSPHEEAIAEGNLGMCLGQMEGRRADARQT